MSWLTDLTKQAESLLTKIDQSAAGKFSEQETSKSTESLNDEYKSKRIGELYTPTNISTNIDIKSDGSNMSPNMKRVSLAPLITKSHSADGKLLSSKRSEKKPLPQETGTSTSSTTSSGTKTKKHNDEKLFEFLNDPSTVKSKPKPLVPPSLPLHAKITPSPSNIKSLPDTPVQVDLGSPETQKIELDVPPEPEKVDNIPPATTVDPEKVEHATPKKVDHTEVSICEMNVMDDSNVDDVMALLREENQILKRDVKNLNEELSRAVAQVKEQMDETEKYKMRYENRRNQQNEDYEKVRGEYESQLTDLKEALSAKDSQLAVLRVRINEADNDIKVKSQSLLEVQTHNEQLMKDHSDSSGLQSHALENLRKQLQDVETQLSTEQCENVNAKSEVIALQEKIVSEQSAYSENLKQLEVKHAQEKEKLRDVELKVKQSDDDAESARKELDKYKEKAGRILQAKEKLIAALKQSRGTDMPAIIGTELEEAKQERDSVTGELTEVRYKMEQLKSEYQELEYLHNTTIEDNQQVVENLTMSLQSETSKNQHLEDDLSRSKQELEVSNAEVHKLRKAQVFQGQQYEEEIKKLESRLKVKQHTTSSQVELENRIRTLTDSLIQKQTVVETLSTEKNSLVLQLERLEKQYYDTQKILQHRKKQKSESGGGGFDDFDSNARQQSMQSILPQQFLRNKHWKTTANEFDKFSVRFGVFLRRYPAARLMVFFYMFLLHLWVTFVLFTYTPEVHPHDAP